MCTPSRMPSAISSGPWRCGRWSPTQHVRIGQDRPALLQRTAEVAVLSGAYGRAAELGRLALAELGPDADPTRRAWFHERLRWYLFESGDETGAVAALREAEELVPATDTSGARAIIVAHRAGMEMVEGRLIRSMANATEAASLAHGSNVPAQEAMAIGIIGWDRALLGDVEGGLGVFRQALAVAEDRGGVEGVALGRSRLAALLDRVGRPAEALNVATEGYAWATAMGVARTYGGILLATEASACFELGRWDQADRATALGLERGPTGRTALALLAARARLEVARGDLDAATTHLAEADRISGTVGGSEHRMPLLTAATELALGMDRFLECRALVGPGMDRLPDGPPDPIVSALAVVGIRAEAEAAERARARHDRVVEDDARREGHRLAERLWGQRTPEEAGFPLASEEAGFPPASEVGVRLTALRAFVTAELGRLDGRADPGAWADAAQRSEELGRLYPAAYARYRLGAAILAARGTRAGASEALRAAHAGASGLGATPLREEVELLARQARIDLETTAAAEPPSRDGAPASPLSALGLTDRELEVLRLVSGGWTNQQIADHLFISPKTASVHVSNILGKMGVDSRVEAAAVAHRLGGPAADPPLPPDAVR